jgi:hypothetical protein
LLLLLVVVVLRLLWVWVAATAAAVAAVQQRVLLASGSVQAGLGLCTMLLTGCTTALVCRQLQQQCHLV